jgi:hypothetical protein
MEIEILFYEMIYNLNIQSELYRKKGKKGIQINKIIQISHSKSNQFITSINRWKSYIYF